MNPCLDSGMSIIRLPYLLPGTEERGLPAGLRPLYLWPGMPEVPSEGYLVPQNYPLSPLMARKFLTELEALDADLLSQTRNRAIARENNASRQRRQEMEDIAFFEKEGACGETGKQGEDLCLEAQKFLLWIWMAQSRALEIASLANKFGKSAAIFSQVLAEGEDAIPSPLAGEIYLDAHIWPSWKSVLYNALFFVPPQTAIFTEGAMRSDMLETYDFAESSIDGIVMAAASVEKMLDVADEKLPSGHRRQILLLAIA